jgi:hypothetical protein
MWLKMAYVNLSVPVLRWRQGCYCSIKLTASWVSLRAQIIAAARFISRPFLPYFCIHGPIQNCRPQRHMIRLLEFDHGSTTNLDAAADGIAAAAWRVQVNS